MSRKQISAEEAQAIESSFSGKLCPIGLGAGTQAAAPPIISAIGRSVTEPNSPEAIGCQGPNCMWFELVSDPSGKIVGGACAAQVIGRALSQLAVSFQKPTGPTH